MSLYSWIFNELADLDHQIDKFRQFKIAYSEANVFPISRIDFDRDHENPSLLTKTIY